MYSNVGKKIMILAMVFGVVFLAAGLVGFVVLLALEIPAWLAFIALLGGIITFMSSWLLYGFGQLVDDVHSLHIGPKPDEKKEEVIDELPEL